MGLHHKLCHVLGGTFGLPHAETHTVVLPYALAYNAPAAPEAMTRARPRPGHGRRPTAPSGNSPAGWAHPAPSPNSA